MENSSRALPPLFRDKLALPVIASPMFIVSRPELVVAECLSGIVGSFPALNARAPMQRPRPPRRGTGAVSERSGLDLSPKTPPQGSRSVPAAAPLRACPDVV